MVAMLGSVVNLLASSGPHHSPKPGEVVSWVLLGILCLAVWIALAIWPARVAEEKGQSFTGYFIFSLICFPAALCAAYLVGNRREAAHQ